MDAATPSATPTFANRTPLRIGASALVVRDLDKVSGYYRDMLGLKEIERTGDTLRLGAGGVPFLVLEHRPDAKPDDDREAGLYHNAFLMPTRADLARWVLHVAKKRIPITGASDHGVSEAFYLDDPEGNGVEVYADRPPSSWRWQGDMVEMITEPLDIGAIVQEVDPQASYDGAPDGLRIGHIHLRVGNIEEAERFYRDAAGLDVIRRRGGATFMSSGRYHHHVGANVWHSNGAAKRGPDRAGLSWFIFEAENAAMLDALATRLQAAGIAIEKTADGFETRDPWGTRIRAVAA